MAGATKAIGLAILPALIFISNSMVKACPKKGDKVTDICYNCSENGHRRPNCPYPKALV